MSEDLTNKLPQSDRQILTSILTTVQRLDGHVTGLDGRFSGLEGSFDKLESRFDRLESRFDGLERRFDGLETRFDRFEAEMRGDIRALNNVVGDLSRNQTVLTDTVRKMDQNLRDVFERLHIVEVVRNQQNSTT